MARKPLPHAFTLDCFRPGYGSRSLDAKRFGSASINRCCRGHHGFRVERRRRSCRTRL